MAARVHSWQRYDRPIDLPLAALTAGPWQCHGTVMGIDATGVALTMGLQPAILVYRKDTGMAVL